MTKVYFIEETIYGNDNTDSEIIFATLSENFAKLKKDELEQKRDEKKRYHIAYTLSSVELTTE